MAHPKIFISYSHDSDIHRERVLGLAERLRSDGFEAMVDRYVEGSPPQGWPRWMLNQIDWADRLLLVCTETYYRRFRGLEDSGVGRGVDWEGGVITNELYDQKSVSTRFVPVVFDLADIQFVPEPLRAFTIYTLTSEAGYEALTKGLAGAAGVMPAPIGAQPDRKHPTGSAIRFPADPPGAGSGSVAAPAAPDLSCRSAPGGTMPAGDTHYVERGVDRVVHDAAKRPETLVVKGPRQFGKSSLLARYIARCRAHGKAVAAIDFSMFEEGIISDYGRFLTRLASQLAHRLKVAPIGDLRYQSEFLVYVETQLLPAVTSEIVIVFDETDRILRQTYAQDFFSMVRMWHNDRADPMLDWHRLGLALASSSEPKLFIKDVLRSPFNVGVRLSLEPFTLQEALALNARYGSPLSDPHCQRLHDLLGGHPFLTQDAYYQLFGPNPISFSDLCQRAARDDGPFGEHLRAMLSNLHAGEGLLAAFREVIAWGRVSRKDDLYRLEGAGLARRGLDGRIMPSNQIYADFFRHAS